MSHPYNGSHIVSDNISHQNVQDLQSHLGELRPTLELLELADHLGGNELVEQIFGKRKPRDRGERSVLDASETSELCDACRSIFTEETEKLTSWYPFIKEQTRHHASLEDLKNAATTGCHMCIVLWNRIMNKLPSVHKDKCYTTYSVASGSNRDGDDDDGVYNLSFVYKGHDTPFSYTECHRLRLCMIPTTSLQDTVTEDAISMRTTVEQRLDFFRDCLTACMQDHQKCRANMDGNWRPTRLIDLGAEGQETVRLDISSVVSRYVTLSHRWGNADIFKATKLGLKKLQIAIEINILPKTFIEAFSVCRKLGYQYLWIDSLCILQDDEDDWKKEACLMGSVYANADLNISATGAEDSDSGLFLHYEPKLVAPIKVMISKPGSLFTTGSYYILDPQTWSAGVSEAPLNSRGWVFQERLLARRVLHFGREQFYFECRQNDACEGFPKGLPTEPNYAWRGLGAVSNRHFKQLDPVIDGWRARMESGGRQFEDESLNPYQAWAELVETYSGLKLTKATDKLIALSGVVKFLYSFLNDDEYLAGLWRRHLPYHLLWSKREHLRRGTNSVEYCAPSWSWASIKDQVDMYPVSTSSDDELILIDILEAEVIPVSEDKTGQLLGGYIKLYGCVRLARWAFYSTDEAFYSTSEKPIIDNLIPRLTLQDFESPAKINVWEDEWDRLCMDRGQDDNACVFCLPIHVWWKDGDICTNGLLLKAMEWESTTPTSSSFPSLFQRVGRFKIDRADVEGHNQFYAFDRACMVDQDLGELTPESIRAAAKENLSWHEITII